MSWWVEVDGRVLPKQLAGHPALELVNTRSGWGEAWDDRQEYLRGYPWLVTLARTNAVVTEEVAARLERAAARRPDEAARELERARGIRPDLYAALLGEATDAAFARVGAAVAEARARQVLVRDHESGSATWRFAGRPTLADPLDEFLVAAGELLAAPTAGRVARCPGAGCGWLFVDHSGRRRWCQMAVCGNRAKQARHAGRNGH
jgi:predicted RNA-binding Zn ribbon-like protein